MIELRGDYAVARGQVVAVTGGQTGFAMIDSPYGPPPVRVSNGGTMTFHTDAIGEVYGFRTLTSDWEAAYLQNLAGGVIRLNATSSEAELHGFFGGHGWPPAFINDGLMEVISAGDAFGLTPYGHSGPISNNGTLLVQAAGHAIGVQRFQGGSVYNSGLIEVVGGRSAIGVLLEGDCQFRNEGTIVARASGEASIGLRLFVGDLIENIVRIDADIAILDDQDR